MGLRKITSEREWEDVKAASESKRVFVFKHSNTCHTSFQVKKEIEEALDNKLFTEEVYMLVVQELPELSKQIALDTGIEHESPQIIALENGKATYSASHGFIDPVVFSLSFEL